MPSQPARETRKYEVVWTPDGWGVERGGQLVDCFVGQETAIAHACQAAREDARRGCLGIVTTQTSPQEFHCYTPAEVAAQASPRPFPRLVSSR
jgi:hypothetical protein